MRIILPSSVAQPIDREPDVLDAIMAIDNALVDWILHARPENEDQKKEMRQVLALRTQLDQHVNQLVLMRLSLAAASLSPHVARLNVMTAEICGATRSISTVKEVLGAASEVVTIAAQVLAAVAT